MTSKPAKTAADYMAIAVCPALIMVMVGSLVFFLIQIGYSGDWIGRLRWTLFWFVFAMVLVSRIAIEQSAGAAFLYGLALAFATSVMLTQYLGFLWGVWLLLAVIWWTCNKIVWDCTFIDDDQDASGQGLLQISRLDRWTHSQLAKVRAVPPSLTDSTTSGHQTSTSLDSPSALGNPLPRRLPPQSSNRSSHSRRPAPRSARRPQELHAPGLWVLCFSLAAVPVFGLGELLLDSKDSGARRFSFVLLFVYLSAALCLLLLTSFLGLRRYLRQRYLVMPPAMAGSWVSTGLALVVGVLLLALLLPRPATPYSLAAFVTKLGSPAQKTSERAPETSEGAEGRSHSQAQGKRGGQAPENTVSKDQQTGQPDAGRGRADSAAGSPRSSPKVLPPSPNLAIHVERWVSYLVLGVILLAAVFRFWPEISAGLRSLLEALSSLWPVRERKKAAPKSRLPAPRQSEAVALLPNPFQTGLAEQMSLAELVRYSYEGLRVWAQSRGFTPKESETPLELAERLTQSERVLTNEILLLGSYYSHVAYAGQPPAEESRVVLKRLWSVIGPVWQ